MDDNSCILFLNPVVLFNMYFLKGHDVIHKPNCKNKSTNYMVTQPELANQIKTFIMVSFRPPCQFFAIIT